MEPSTVGAGARWGPEHGGGRSTVGAGAAVGSGALWGPGTVGRTRHLVRPFSAQIPEIQSGSCGPRANEGGRSAPSAHKIRNSVGSCNHGANEGGRSPHQRTKSGNSVGSCGHGANEGGRSPHQRQIPRISGEYCVATGRIDISRTPLHLSYFTFFHIQQPFFLIQPARIAGQLPIRSDHPVTGNY